MSPSLLTASRMFSGLVCVGTLRSLGNVSWIDCVTTGMVIRKMISSTSITSTSGVVLMVEFICSSSSSADVRAIAMVDSRKRKGLQLTSALARQQHVVQVAGERAHALHHQLVAADQPVVAHH